MELKTITVFLTEDEAKQFLKFQKHRNLIGLLESIKAFDIRGGSVTLHFREDGTIRCVDKKEVFIA